MSALRDQIAGSAHRWIEGNLDAGCEGHPPHPYGPPFCEQVADSIIADLGWPEAGP